MAGRDLYEVLGIPRDADEEAVRKAYRRIALESHPDRNPGDALAEARFKEATAAYAVLGDPEKRQTYDFNLGLGSGVGPFGSPFRWDPQEIFEDIVGAVRNGRRRGPVPNRGSGYGPEFRQEWHGPAPSSSPGEDVEADLSVTLEEAASGCVREVASKSRIRTVCQSCSGTGCRSGTGTFECGSCSGSGRALDFRIGPQDAVRRCPTCAGSGRRPISPCPTCSGAGRVMTSRSVKIRVPAGIDDGQRLRLAGMGAPGDGGPPGDMYVTVRIVPHGRFSRKGSDLHADHAVPLSVAVLGGCAMVPTLDGPPVRIDVPPDAVPGRTVVTVKGAGMREAGAERRGDLHVTVQVELPKVVTARGRKLLEELMEEVGAGRSDP